MAIIFDHESVKAKLVELRGCRLIEFKGLNCVALRRLKVYYINNLIETFRRSEFERDEIAGKIRRRYRGQFASPLLRIKLHFSTLHSDKHMGN